MLQPDAAMAFQERARSGKVCLGVHTSAMSPQLVELYGLLKLDFVIIGTEVESLDLARMEDMIRAADAARTVPVVKLRRPDPNLIADAMNAGAPMVMVPHITTRAQLETIVGATRFEPEGTRGVCPLARYNGYGALPLGEVRDIANRARSVIPIIEDEEALHHLDELMSVDGVDIFEIGPFDLSASLDERGQGYTGKKTMAAIERICAAARAHGKAVLAPIWYTRDLDSYPKVIQHQMDELIARGINVLYELETVFLSLHLSRLRLLRGVRAVDEEADEVAAPAPVAVKARARATPPPRARARPRAARMRARGRRS